MVLLFFEWPFRQLGGLATADEAFAGLLRAHPKTAVLKED
ncbi:hypothetical protein [Polaromonas sp. CG9_12]|nr:hypothetical protein [Polaromonas sp. CG9_12]